MLSVQGRGVARWGAGIGSASTVRTRGRSVRSQADRPRSLTEVSPALRRRLWARPRLRGVRPAAVGPAPLAMPRGERGARPSRFGRGPSRGESKEAAAIAGSPKTPKAAQQGPNVEVTWTFLRKPNRKRVYFFFFLTFFCFWVSRFLLKCSPREMGGSRHRPFAGPGLLAPRRRLTSKQSKAQTLRHQARDYRRRVIGTII